MNNEYKKLILIFLIALSLRMLFFIVVGSWHDNVMEERILPFGDARGYHSIAVSIVQNKPLPGVMDAPIYLSFIASLYAIFGYKPYIPIIFQIIMSALTCIFLYKIGRKIFHEKTALFAGLFLAFDSLSIFYSNHLFVGTMFTFIFIFHIYFLMKFLMEKNIRALVYSAIFLGLSTLCKTVSIYFPILLIWPFFIYFRNNLRKGILTFSILMSIYLLMITPWMLRNYIVTDRFLFSQYQTDILSGFIPNIMDAINPPHSIKSSPIEKEAYPQQTEKVQNQGSNYSKTRIEAQAITTKKIIKAVLADTESRIKGVVRYFIILDSGPFIKTLGLQAYVMTPETWNEGFLEAVKVAIQKKSKLEWFYICFRITVLFYLYSTVCFGIYNAIRKKKFKEVVLFVSVIVYFVIASAGQASTYRANYRIPIMPYMIILSCYGMKELIHRFRMSSTGSPQTLSSASKKLITKISKLLLKI